MYNLWAMKRSPLIILSAALLVAPLGVAALPAQAADYSQPLAPSASVTLARAYQDSVASSATTGLWIVTDEKGSRARTLFGQSVDADRELEYAYSSRPSGEYSISVTDEGRFLASWGNNPTDGRWSTLGAAGSWSLAFVSGSPLNLTTIVKGMDRRLDMDAADVATRQIAVNLALPPGTDNGGRSWTSVRAVKKGATTVITARGRSKSCTYPSISITVRAGLITESSWTSVCGKVGKISHESVWRYQQGYIGAGRTAISQSEAMATSANPSRSNSWKALTKAANETAATTWTNITRTYDSTPTVVENQLTVVQGLQLLDVLIRNGSTGVVRGPADNGPGTYLITGSGTNAYFLTVGDTKYAGGTVTIGPDGRVTSLDLNYMKGNAVDGESVTFIR